jgi:hypothetical protein
VRANDLLERGDLAIRQLRELAALALGEPAPAKRGSTIRFWIVILQKSSRFASVLH